MSHKVSFQNYRFRDKVCISALMGCIALCGVFAADRYVKKDSRGALAGAIGMGINTVLVAKCSQVARKKARHRMYRRQREQD
ncbi:MAG: hypothetical protein IKQ99_02265 [Alphaproteobacteria bacterium]|nr:hypothetical protein [Alphaproteobacteria bacterium]